MTVACVSFPSSVKAQELPNIPSHIRVVTPLQEDDNWIKPANPNKNSNNYFSILDDTRNRFLNYELVFLDNSSPKLRSKFNANDFLNKVPDDFIYNGGYIIWGALQNLFLY